MGLDQYAYIATAEEIEASKGKDGPRLKETFYWRKHNRLQGWMENLWGSKGGEGEFNCVDVELTLEDVECLERDIHGESLPETCGFFFGSDSYNQDYKSSCGYFDLDCEFCAAAKEAIQSGKKVIYSSWW